MQQRALLTETAVGAGKYVDDVILGAPVTVTKNLCTTMNITVVASGSKHTNMKLQASSDHYAVPKELGMFTAVESGHSMTTATIRERCAAVPLSGSQCRGLWARTPDRTGACLPGGSCPSDQPARVAPCLQTARTEPD